MEVSAEEWRDGSVSANDVVSVGVSCPAGDGGGSDGGEGAGTVVSVTGRLEVGC